MQNTEILTESIPWFAVDRRHRADRRKEWRGGRRDTDWTENRPPGALNGPVARRAWVTALRRLVAGGTH